MNIYISLYNLINIHMYHIYDDFGAKSKCRGLGLVITSPKIYSAVCNFLSYPYSRYMLRAQKYPYEIIRWSRLWISRGCCSIALTDIRFGGHENTPSAFQYTRCRSAEKKVAILPPGAYQFLGPLLLTLFNFKSQHGQVITSIIMCGMKLLIHS